MEVDDEEGSGGRGGDDGGEFRVGCYFCELDCFAGGCLLAGGGEAVLSIDGCVGGRHCEEMNWVLPEDGYEW